MDAPGVTTEDAMSHHYDVCDDCLKNYCICGTEPMTDHAQRAVELAGSHYNCEDPWYSCPKSSDGCVNDAQGPECNCGVDKRTKQIDAALTQAHADGRREGMEKSATVVEGMYLKPEHIWDADTLDGAINAIRAKAKEGV